MKVDKELLRVHRAKKQISKITVERKTGINRKKYSAYEKDPSKCTLSELIELSKILEFDVKNIFLD